MLVVRRQEGDWTEITHSESGEILRFRVYSIRRGWLRIAFEDDARNFDIQRPERAEAHDARP